MDHASARQFIAWTVAQKHPAPWKLEWWKDVSTTQSYTHVLNRPEVAVGQSR